LEKLDAGKTAKQLFQRRALNRKEFEEIRSLSSGDQPTKAAEQLLQLVLSQSEDICACFLDSLLKTDQTHVHQWIVLEGLSVQCHFNKPDSRHFRLFIKMMTTTLCA